MRRLTIMLLVFGTACGTEPEAVSFFQVADSAGVEIITTDVAQWGPNGSPWTLSLETEIGEIEGDEPYLFGDPVSPVRLPDGRIAVADAQSADIRFFGPDGTFLSRTGSRGQGPGEFMSFGWMAKCDGKLLAYDWQQARVTSISFDGMADDPFGFRTPEDQSPYTSTCLPDGSLLAAGWGQRPEMPPGEEFLFYAQRAELWRTFPESDSVVPLGTYISSERLMHIDRNTGGGGSGPHPFSRSVVFAGTQDRILIGGAERLQVEVRSLDGNLLKILRGPDSDLLIDDVLVSSYQSADLTDGQTALRTRLADAGNPMPERYPAYTSMLVDPLGYLWVERFILPWVATREWGVFDPEGVFLGDFPIPANLQITDVTEDHVIGIATDELDVARIQVYRLTRSEGDAG